MEKWQSLVYRASLLRKWTANVVPWVQIPSSPPITINTYMKLQELTESFAKKTYRDHRIPQELIDAVKQYAKEHYETDGWDYVIETMDDMEIAQEISGAVTPKEAIAKMYDLVKMLDVHRKEIQSTAF